MKTKKRRIIGIDPGLAATGWGIVDCFGGKIKYVDHGTIQTKLRLAKDPAVIQARADRLYFILHSIRLLIEKYKPTEAAIEILFFGKNVTSAIPVAESRGVVSAAIAEKGIPLYEFTPNVIKTGVVGSSRADKKQVQQMVKIILGLDEIPKPDHAADALAAAICRANGFAFTDK